MKDTIRGLIAPHAPTMLEDELDRKASAVNIKLQEIGKELLDWGIEAVVAVSTHWQTESFLVDDADFHRTVTDYYGFRREIEYDVAGKPELARQLLASGEKNLVYPVAAQHGVDHAITIPLHFMFPEKNIPVIPVSVAGSALSAFRWGRILGHTLRQWGGKTLMLVSGSLSHDLMAFMTGRRRDEYEAFDRQVMQLLTAGNGMDLLNMDSRLIAAAKPEGAFRDLYMLLGAMGSQSRGRVAAYENLPGVGLGVIEFTEAAYAETEEEWLAAFPASGSIH